MDRRKRMQRAVNSVIKAVDSSFKALGYVERPEQQPNVSGFWRQFPKSLEMEREKK